MEKNNAVYIYTLYMLSWNDCSTFQHEPVYEIKHVGCEHTNQPVLHITEAAEPPIRSFKAPSEPLGSNFPLAPGTRSSHLPWWAQSCHALLQDMLQQSQQRWARLTHPGSEWPKSPDKNEVSITFLNWPTTVVGDKVMVSWRRKETNITTSSPYFGILWSYNTNNLHNATCIEFVGEKWANQFYMQNVHAGSFVQWLELRLTKGSGFFQGESLMSWVVVFELQWFSDVIIKHSAVPTLLPTKLVYHCWISLNLRSIDVTKAKNTAKNSQFKQNHRYINLRRNSWEKLWETPKSPERGWLGGGFNPFEKY